METKRGVEKVDCQMARRIGLGRGRGRTRLWKGERENRRRKPGRTNKEEEFDVAASIKPGGGGVWTRPPPPLVGEHRAGKRRKRGPLGPVSSRGVPRPRRKEGGRTAPLTKGTRGGRNEEFVETGGGSRGAVKDGVSTEGV